MKPIFTKLIAAAALFGIHAATGPVASHAQLAPASCTPTYSSGCNAGDNIDDVTLVGQTVTLSNMNTPCPTGGYMDYTTSTTLGVPDLVIGGTYNGTVTTTYSSAYEYVKIYIDVNNNGIFETNEELASFGPISISSTGAYSITIPGTATAGDRRMRVTLVYGSAPTGPCGSYTWGETHDYKVTLLPPPPCASATFPTTVATLANPASLCMSGTSELSMSATMPVATGVNYQWESATALAGPYTAIAGATSETYAATGMPTNTYFRCKVFCNSTLILTSDPVLVTVDNPGTVSVTGASRCGPGPVTLSATPANSTSNVLWYADPTGGIPLGTGNTFTTPYLPATTTFYAVANAGAASLPPTWVGTGTATSSGNPNPFYTFYWGLKNQYLIRASELVAAGLTAGTITELGFDVVANSGLPMNNFYISMKQTNITALTSTWETGLTTVYTHTGALNLTANSVNNFVFQTPFVWDGVSNIIIETCFNNTTWSSGHSVRYTTGLGFNATHYYQSDVNNVCSSPSTGSLLTSRPNMRFKITAGCEASPRVPVVATVNNGAAVTKVAPPVVCNNAVATFSVTLPTNGQYQPYKFYPNTNLYTDAAATIPYTGGPATTVYFKSNVSGPHTFYGIGGDTTVANTVCARADTFNIWVQPANNTIDAVLDTLCVSDEAELMLATDTSFAPGSVQWQQSTNGTTWTNVPGANFASFVSPTISANTWFRAVINGNNTVCHTVDKEIFVVTPQLVSTLEDERCGPGSVTLQATPGTNSVIRWYDNPQGAMGGPSLHQGNTFTTPNIDTTTTYYVTAGTGSAPMQPTWIGNGTTTSSGNPNPFYTLYWGLKNQYLIRASELVAAGLTAGTITEIAFDVVAASGLPMNGLYFAMKQTNITTLSTTWETGLTTVYTHTGAYMPTANSVAAFTLQTPFYWDGVSNIIIETCFNNTSWSSGHSVKYTTGLPFNATHYYQSDVTTVCTAPLTGSLLTSRPNIRLSITGGCETPPVPVVAHIREFPQVDLGTNLDTCVDDGLSFTVDAGPQPAGTTYLWDDNTTNSTRLINSSGVYHVAVTNQYGCTTNDTLNIFIRSNPRVNLAANGLNLCEGATKVLDAGPDGENGGSYYWSTGATSRTITVGAAGTYIVYVTSAEGCLKVDTANIVVSGQMPHVDGISVTAVGPTSFNFTAMNPQHVVEYIWVIEDDTISSGSSPTMLSPYVFPGNGNYWVKLLTNSICGQTADSIMVTIFGTGINGAENDLNIKVYPNPSHGEQITLETEGDVNISGVSIYNIVGQEVFVDRNVKANGNKYTISLGQTLAPGVYNLRIQTDKGLVNRKIEILK